VWSRLIAFVLAGAILAPAHGLVTTRLTWAKEISRIVYKRCLACHRPDGPAFSLRTYEDARPWAKAIQEEVLRRRMPPWNAVKGFGEFDPDFGLSGEEIQQIAEWVDGGAPLGDPNLLPPGPRIPDFPEAPPGTRLAVTPGLKTTRPLRILAIELSPLTPGANFRLTATTPQGEILPLLWIHNYSPRATQVYQLRQPLRLPAGSRLDLTPAAGIQLKLVTGP
jgi:hypothetical protein